MGDYSITREQFTAGNRVALKILQDGVFLVDSDYNEMNRILEHKINRILWAFTWRDTVGARFGTGFSFKTGGTNTVTLNKGDAFIPRPEVSGEFLHYWQDSDIVSSGWSTPSGSDRTDFLYLDVYFDIVDSDDDEDLINPQVAEESMVDIRLTIDWTKQEGGSFPSPPTGHKYVKVLTINRLNGNSSITEAMCVHELRDLRFLFADGSHDLYGNLTVASGITIDGRDLSKIVRNVYTQNKVAAFTDDATCPDWADADAWYRTGQDLTPANSTIIRAGFRLRQADRYILFSGEAKCGGNSDKIRFGVGPWDNPSYYSEITIEATSWGTYYSGSFDMNSLGYSVGDWVNCGVALFNQYSGATEAYLRRVTLDIAQEVP